MSQFSPPVTKVSHQVFMNAKLITLFTNSTNCQFVSANPAFIHLHFSYNLKLLQQPRSRRFTRRTTAPFGNASNDQSNQKHAEQLQRWFCQLTPEERGRVLSFEDKEGVVLLRYFLIKKKKFFIFFTVDFRKCLKTLQNSKSTLGYAGS